VRMYNDDVIDLYARVPIGTKVIVTWQRYAW
jgi:lipoprotein-anchoring transpeptidase ErfK/SrfK